MPKTKNGTAKLAQILWIAVSLKFLSQVESNLVTKINSEYVQRKMRNLLSLTFSRKGLAL